MMKNISIPRCLLLFAGIALSSNAFAVHQCIHNDSGTSLNVTWKNANGKKNHKASNANLLYGQTACRKGHHSMGYAVIQCNGCDVASGFAKAAIITGGVAAGVACTAVSGGACAEAFVNAAIEQGVEQGSQGTSEIKQVLDLVPDGDMKKTVVVPANGKTIKVTGNAFGLKFEH